MLLLLLHLPLAAHADPPAPGADPDTVLVHHASDTFVALDSDAREIGSDVVTVRYRNEEYAVGSTVYVVGDGVNLRTGPGTSSAVVAKLPAGTPVSVQAAGPVGWAEGRQERWYEVATQGGEAQVQGYVFGGVLTPARLEVDLDEDGQMELVTVAFSASHDIVLRFIEQDSANDRRVVTLNLGGWGDINGTLDELHASTTSRHETGAPLVMIHVPNRYMCGSWNLTVYASYTSPGSGQPGVAKDALRTIVGCDEPLCFASEVAFHPKAKEATVTTRSREAEDKRDVTEVTRSRMVYKEGIFTSVQQSTWTEIKERP